MTEGRQKEKGLDEKTAGKEAETMGRSRERWNAEERLREDRRG